MGRHRKHVAGYKGSKQPKKVQFTIEERLGHYNEICANCNAKLRRGRDKCSKCGKKEGRRNAKHPSVGFRGKGTEGSGF